MQNIHLKQGTDPQQLTTAPFGVTDDPMRKRARKVKDTALALFDRSYIWMNKLFKLSP